VHMLCVWFAHLFGTLASLILCLCERAAENIYDPNYSQLSFNIFVVASCNHLISTIFEVVSCNQSLTILDGRIFAAQFVATHACVCAVVFRFPQIILV
jgi:hypothetical protein